MNMRERVRAEAEKDPFATLQEIGDRVGVSRERVRQIFGYLGIDSQARKLNRTKANLEARKHLPKGNFFVAMVRGWLREIDHGYCCVCHGYYPLYQMVNQGNGRNPVRCRKCAAESVHKSKERNPGYSIRYRQEHREQINIYPREYNRRKREEARSAL